MKITNNIPRALAERYTKYHFYKPSEIVQPTCIISINEPGEPEAALRETVFEAPGWDDILRVAFWDVTKPISRSVWGPQHVGKEVEVYEPMTEEQGKLIADFIRKNWDSSIIVHCRAGISRSAAIVRLLLELGWQEGTEVRVHDQSGYNIHVYSTLKKHFPELLPIGT